MCVLWDEVQTAGTFGAYAHVKQFYLMFLIYNFINSWFECKISGRRMAFNFSWNGEPISCLWLIDKKYVSDGMDSIGSYHQRSALEV